MTWRWSTSVGSFVFAAAACSAPATSGEHLGVDRSADTAASGYCRTTTCPPPASYPVDGACAPPDWSSSETCRASKASGAPLWWRTACVGYDLNAAASRHVAFDDFADAAQRAFLAWTGASCHEGKPQPSSRVSIDVRDLGRIDCAHALYDRTGPNQNVIVFHDDVWPHEAKDRAASGASKSPVIALTTVTFDPDTGELFDADVEINSADYAVIPLSSAANPALADAFDLQAVLTHELGHFLGLAHSPASDAVMNASGDADGGHGSTPKRALRHEDVTAICAVYPPDGSRAVSTLVDPSGRVPAGACDPVPRRGLAASCN